MHVCVRELTLNQAVGGFFPPTNIYKLVKSFQNTWTPSTTWGYIYSGDGSSLRNTFFQPECRIQLLPYLPIVYSFSPPFVLSFALVSLFCSASWTLLYFLLLHVPSLSISWYPCTLSPQLSVCLHLHSSLACNINTFNVLSTLLLPSGVPTPHISEVCLNFLVGKASSYVICHCCHSLSSLYLLPPFSHFKGLL